MEEFMPRDSLSQFAKRSQVKEEDKPKSEV